jgi:O-antigen/teichoic acid export membrane protein
VIHRDTLLVAGLTAGKAVVVIAGLGTTMVVARLAGPEGVGQWSLAIAAGTFVHTAFLNWTHASTVRFGAEEWTVSRSLSGTVAGRWPLVAASALMAAAALGLQPLHWLERAFGVPSAAWWLVGAYALALWVAAEAQAALQALNRLDLQAWLAPLAAAAALVAVLGAGLGGSGSPLRLVAAAACGMLTVWVPATLLLLRRTVRWQPPAMEATLRHLRYGWPLAIAFAVGYVSDWGDHVLLRALTTIEAVGQFGLAYQVFLVLLAINGAVTTLLLPRLIAGNVATGDDGKQYVEQALPTLFVLGALVSLVAVAALPPLLLWIAGPRFGGGAGVLAILCAVAPANVATGLYSVLFSVQQRLSRVLVYTTVMAAVNIVLSLILIPPYGVYGAAAATAVSYGVAQLAYLLDQHRFLRVPAQHVALLWGLCLVFGAGQAAMPTEGGWRLGWVLVTLAVVSFAARSLDAINAPLVDRLFGGALAPVGLILRRTLTR